MAKRSNDDSDTEESPTHSTEYPPDGPKRMKIAFEPVRLPAVSNVNDINNRAKNYQAAKLAQQVKYKNKKIAELERENERLRRRQETDENNFYRIHRHGLELEAQVISAARAELDIESKPDVDDDTQVGATEMLQLEPEQFEKLSKSQKERTVKLLQWWTQSRQKRAEKHKKFCRRVITFMESLTPSTSAEALKEAVAHNAVLAEENAKLVTENSKLQQDMSAARTKLREKVDECDILLSKKEDLMRELEDAKFEADKNLRSANKYEHRLYTFAQEMQSEATQKLASKISNGQSYGSPKPIVGVFDNKEIESIRVERDEQMELANRRLQEISELSAKVQKLSADLSRCKTTENVVSTETILNSEEYKNLQKYYAVAIKEYERVSKELDEVTSDRDRLRQHMTTKIDECKEGYEEYKKKVALISEKVNDDNQQTRIDYDLLRAEFDQLMCKEESKIGDSKQTEIKAILNSMKVQNHVLKQEVAKYKKKWRDTVSMFSKAQRDYEVLRARVDNSILIELEDGKKDGSPNENPAKDLYPDLPEKEMERLRLENEKLVREIRILGRADRAERIRYYEKEMQSSIGQKLSELERLRKEMERAENTEKALSEELDNIGLALEELQEQNGTLISEKRDAEDNRLKMMSDRITSSTLIAKLKDKNNVLEERLQKEEQSMKIVEFEMNILKTSNEKAKETILLKSTENSRLSQTLENHRKLLQEIGLSRDDLQIKIEKYESQLKHVQDLLSAKASNYEGIQHKKNRIDEEYSLLKKKYETVQSTLKLGSTDAVLVEENRRLKETLTCPSCKTKKKDCIMLKCFHLFCESCIKARYDTRQRKCPKCNSGFGANDFHRVFL